MIEIVLFHQRVPFLYQKSMVISLEFCQYDPLMKGYNSESVSDLKAFQGWSCEVM